MLNSSKNTALIISTIVLGFLVGLGSMLLSLFFNLIEELFLHYHETTWAPVAWVSGAGTRFISILVGGIVATLVWWLVRTKMKSTVSINQGIAGKDMPVGTTFVHVLTQIFFVSAGGSVGRELAPRELGAMLSQTWQRLLKKFTNLELSDDDRRLLIAAAAGAGFAGVYIAPITGTMFSLELLLKRVDQRAILVSVTMSIEAMLVGSIEKGFQPYYGVGHDNFSLISTAVVLLIAPVCGLLGGGFRKLFSYANAHQTRDNKILWQLPLVALITAITAIKFPEVMGNGRALAQTAFASTNPKFILEVLIIGAAVKAVVTVLSLRAGASGGTLTPSIAIGAVVGVVFGLILNSFGPGIPLWETGLLGAVSFLAASQQAPFMALFMIFEVCHLNYSALLPLALGVCLAVFTSRVVLGKKN
ncbi:chloride channel protein [Lentilactobacillus curieae]|uniref:Chloride channel protein n=1 Tax=Lentilactobacillus curieae TaxID=1138822 RepID=A0A1S6QH77_9LACO|nr:chloride channel protein [Lentilactobacillus curieae]AQW20949.1 chloride channel protein [Lentilactobacillus curieae]